MAWVRSVAFSPYGARIVSDKTVRVWNVISSNKVIPALRGHEDWVGSVAFSPGGTCIVSESDDNTVHVWDSATGNALLPPFRVHLDSVYLVGFSHPHYLYII